MVQLRQRTSKKNTLRKGLITFNMAAVQPPMTVMSGAAATTTNTAATRTQWLTTIIATIYVLSGSTQPLLMTLVKSSGLGDPTCQVYMLFYYIGPAFVTFTLCCQPMSTLTTKRNDNNNISGGEGLHGNESSAPTSNTVNLILKACSIAVIDVFAQSMNYTGSTMAGPTIFAIIYSSVTVWTAVYSRILLSRQLNCVQWSGVIIVFLGLLVTSVNSVAVGPHVFHGTVLIVAGSSMHALTYVLSEIIMTKEKLSLQLNCSIQAIVACTFYLFWQLFYTRKHFDPLIRIPMMENHTTINQALIILSSLSLSNLIHAVSFFYTLKHFPGGSTSAGVMKGLQAVLVFVFSSLVYCQKIVVVDGKKEEEGKKYGGEEMCFTFTKFLSLIVVLTGVLLFAVATDGAKNTFDGDSAQHDGRSSLPFSAKNKGYRQIDSVEIEDDNPRKTTM
mmetsp:Transcript_19240/g.28827  ORF Transcript_19240/g.28827 Transcript_19240/m.28827 type:complete len:445 (-) Transcript_19240:102-1436(-)